MGLVYHEIGKQLLSFYDVVYLIQTQTIRDIVK